MIYAKRVEHAANRNTDFRLVAYESWAIRRRSGGSDDTSRAFCLIFFTNWDNVVSVYLTRCLFYHLTSSAPGPWIRFSSSDFNLDWKMAEDTATPPTWPRIGKSWFRRYWMRFWSLRTDAPPELSKSSADCHCIICFGNKSMESRFRANCIPGRWTSSATGYLKLARRFVRLEWRTKHSL